MQDSLNSFTSSVRSPGSPVTSTPRPPGRSPKPRDSIEMWLDYKREQEVQLALGARGSVRQCFEHLQPLRAVRNRFHIGRALAGSLPGLLPIGNRLGNQSRFGVVMGDQLRLSSRGVGKAFL